MALMCGLRKNPIHLEGGTTGVSGPALLYVYKTSESCNYDSQQDMRWNGGLHWWEQENACVGFDSGMGYVTSNKYKYLRAF